MSKYINADDFIDKVANAPMPSDVPTLSKIKLIQLISKFPKADVVPVIHARWITDNNPNYDDAECSHCGVRSLWLIDDDNKMNYCPTCGAKMDLEE